MPVKFNQTAKPALGLLSGLAVISVLGCTTPPPEAYTSGPTSSRLESRSVGGNARGEACQAQPGRAPGLDLPVTRSEEAFCGGWTQPAARVFTLNGNLALDTVVAGGQWRSWLDQRFECGTAQTTTVATGLPARLLPCTRRSTGATHLALAVAGPTGIVLSDGLPSSLPVIERMITGQSATGRVARSEALQIAISRLAADRVGAADEASFERLMLLGEELNQTENFAGAEEAYRQALAERARIVRTADDPSLGLPTVHVALNLSNQGRFQEADRLFQRAEILLAGSADRNAAARLAHYRGIHELNRDRLTAAAERMMLAEASYRSLLPNQSSGSGRGTEAAALGFSQVLRSRSIAAVDIRDPQTETAARGLAEALRYRAIIASRQGQAEEVASLLTESRAVLAEAGLSSGVLDGRSLRTAGVSYVRADQRNAGIRQVNLASERFATTLPGERPVAASRFIAGRELLAADRLAEALEAFRSGAEILRERRIGLAVNSILPYLDSLELAASRNPARAVDLRAEAFGAAQLARRNEAARFLTQSSARLVASGGNEQVAALLRRRQDLDLELRALLNDRDQLVANGRSVIDIDGRIADRRASREEAESEAAALAPEYRQLLVETVTAADMSAKLAEREALIQFLVGPEFSYALAMRQGRPVSMARLAVGEAELGRLVQAARSSVDANPSSPAALAAFDTGAAAALYDLLLRPVEGMLEGADALVVVPDGPLLSLPFGMLLTGPASPDSLRSAPWLLRQYSIVHTPSVQSLASLRGRAPTSTAARPFIGFGDFRPPSRAQLVRSFPAGLGRCGRDAEIAAGLGSLPNSSREIQLAAETMGRNSVIRLGANFTRDAVLGTNLREFRVIHFATHGLLPGDLSCLLEPAIMVSNPPGAADATGSFLTSSAIMRLRLDADLVVLSACNTAGPGVAGGSEQSAEALSGLASAFFFAGARGLLTTHWSVNDLAATAIMARMLAIQEGADTAARSGTSSARALQAAQIALLDVSGGALAHPYYWAPFALIGDGRRDLGTQAKIGPRESVASR